MRLIQKLRGLQSDARGLSTVEYSVLLVLIVAGTVGLWQTLGTSVKGKITGSTTAYDTAVIP